MSLKKLGLAAMMVTGLFAVFAGKRSARQPSQQGKPAGTRTGPLRQHRSDR